MDSNTKEIQKIMDPYSEITKDNAIDKQSDTKHNIDDKENELFRLLGYYNDPSKELVSDEPLSDETKILAEKLQKSFQETNDPNKYKDNHFSNAVQEYIFLLKDKKSRLYIYWPKNHVLQIQPIGAELDRENLISLALEYKNWFKPGEKIDIDLLGTANVFTQYQNFYLYDFLRSFYKPGSWIEINSTYNVNAEPIKGAIQVVGKDFVIIQTKDLKTICATKHMNIQIGNREDANRTNDEEDSLEPMGTVLDTHPQIIIRGNSGKIYQGKTTNALEFLRQGDKVYFTPKNEKYANFIHKAGATSYCYQLAKSKIKSNHISEGTAILNHILECFPDNSLATDLLASLTPKNSTTDREKKYDEARTKWQEGDKETACKMFLELLNKNNDSDDDSVNTECIQNISSYYVEKYLLSADEDDRNIAKEFIEEYYSNINTDDAINRKISLYFKLGCYNECIYLIDFQLDDSNLNNIVRARLYHYKSQNLYQIGRYDESEKYALKSLSINPFNNKSEKYLSISNQFTISPSRPLCDDNILYSILTNQIAKKGNKIDSKSILEKAEMWTLESSDDYSFLPFAAVLDDKNSKKYFLEFLYRKASDSYAENPESSIFIWKQIFSMIPGYGFFNHRVLIDALSSILNIEPIDNDESVTELLLFKINETATITKNEWNSIFLVISENEDVINVVLKAIRSNSHLSALLKQYISTIDPTLIAVDIDYVSLVKNINNSLELNNRKAVEKLNNLVSTTYSLGDITNGLTSLDYINYPFSELLLSDNVNLVSIYESILPLVMDYQNEANTQERNLLFERIINEIDEIYLKIFETPTYFSVYGISHILKLISHALIERQGIFDEAILANLSVTITTDTIVPDGKGYYKIGVRVENGEGLAPAENVTLNLRSQKISPLVHKSSNNLVIRIDKIPGGKGVEKYFLLKLSKEITHKPSFGFAINLSATCKGRLIKKVFTPLQVRFPIAGEVFEEITNQPYHPGTGLPYNDQTFFGRDNEVREIVDKILTNDNIGTQLIVYGQARCGKSSLLNRVQGELNSNYSNTIWCVKTQLQIETTPNKPNYDESDFFREILTTIHTELNLINSQIKPQIVIPDFNKESRPVEAFGNAIIDFKKSMSDTPGWENRRFVLILDEFSALYNRIKEGTVSDQVLFHWKGIQENPSTSFATIFVGHDTTPWFFAESYAVNAATIIERKRISYLNKEAAKKLIERPILTSHGRSRFYPAAVQRIIEYTACNPYHIQQFMPSVIKYINEKKIILVTSIDVDMIANDCLSMKGDYYNTRDCFDNLISPGINEKYRKISDNMYLTVLRAIADLNESNSTDDWCKLEEVISRLKESIERSSVREIIQDLLEREVIEELLVNDRDTLVRIKILLFKRWLLKQ